MVEIVGLSPKIGLMGTWAMGSGMGSGRVMSSHL